MSHRVAIVLAVIAMVATLVGCRDGETRVATPGATVSATPTPTTVQATPSATAQRATSTPAPSPAATSTSRPRSGVLTASQIGALDPSTRTGIDRVDAVIDAMLAADGERLEDMVAWEQMPCVVQQSGFPVQPVCRADEADGELVEAFLTYDGEGAYYRPGDLKLRISRALREERALCNIDYREDRGIETYSIQLRSAASDGVYGTTDDATIVLSAGEVVSFGTLRDPGVPIESLQCKGFTDAYRERHPA